MKQHAFIKPPKQLPRKARHLNLENLSATISELVRGAKASEITIQLSSGETLPEGVTRIAGQELVDLKREITTEGNQFKGVLEHGF